MENQFVNGMRVYKPSEKAPDFIKANIEVDVATLTLWLEEHANGTGKVRIVVKEGKSGAYYAAKDTYERKVEPPTDNNMMADIF